VRLTDDGHLMNRIYTQDKIFFLFLVVSLLEEKVKLPFSTDDGHQHNSLSYFEGATTKINIYCTGPIW
jgi:hypothetical protein